MELKNFLYLNTEVVKNYIAAIDGYIYDEESQSIETSKENVLSGKIATFIASGKGAHTEKHSEEVKRSLSFSDSAKFEKIYSYLQEDEYNRLKYYESLDDSNYKEVSRGDFLEVLVDVRFSRMKELANVVTKCANLTKCIEYATGRQYLDKKTNEAIQGITALDHINSDNKISCVFEFSDKNYPLVADLDKSYFKCKPEHFVGTVYLVCKVIRKIPKGQKISLDEVFDAIKKLPLNRELRRAMPKNLENPAFLRDVIKGPALIVLPIAVYQ